MTPYARSCALALFLLAGACAPKQTVKPVAAPPPVRVQSYPVTGLEAVIGRTAATLQAQFGRPDLDIREGPARKLQFSAPACVLDAYLYAPKAGSKEPIVTHVDARLPNGADFDRASCVAALAQAQR
ncbi:MAG TPA: hypothetical protein VF680_06330 [Allosphingosinicella sp.]|jgi:hypothetical protein